MMAIAFLLQTLRIAVPYLLAAAGGVLSERVGVIALGLEGLMLSGAFGAALGAYYGDSAWAGLAGALAAGAVMTTILAVATLRFRANQVVVGVAINLIVVAGTRYFLRLIFDSSSNSPRVAGFGGEGVGNAMLASFTNPVVWIGLVTLPALGWVLYRTPFGLRVRAIGEKPEAAASLGVNVMRLRVLGLYIAGAMAALGGAYLALDQHQFTDGMTAGRGFIALAAVIFGRWQPARVAVACLLFAAAETLQIQLQGAQLVPSQFVEMIPYVLTIIALAGLVGRSTAPAALGKTE
ncbi:MAG: ABC transporter permease [Gemmatimonas sp.]|uniref:ABC transporter permease n=1 Tax=Gemmatimonas sp. UBA7669 TaxID=1946568 RepID=UPI0025C29261|nr:ABC transporter permease [Gemmatimonas sp. UBA7669]MBA3917255.1 ABC transporter permease [Gemmatimonas sp.]